MYICAPWPLSAKIRYSHVPGIAHIVTLIHKHVTHPFVPPRISTKHVYPVRAIIMCISLITGPLYIDSDASSRRVGADPSVPTRRCRYVGSRLVGTCLSMSYITLFISFASNQYASHVPHMYVLSLKYVPQVLHPLSCANKYALNVFSAPSCAE